MDIQGQAAIVTGGASGLGGATARALASKGAKVAIFDMNKELGEKVAAEVGGVFVNCNVTSADNVEAALSDAAAAHGTARIIVNCAGVGTPAKAVGRDGPMALDVFTKIVEINLIGTFNVIRLAAAAMMEDEPLATLERGIVINTASVAAFDGQIGQPAYAASKAGVVGMTLPLAREFARSGIRVLTIAPGIFLTPMLENSLSEEAKASLGAQVPFPSRLGRPDEFAQLAIQMCENEMLNGETIRLDGAIRMAPK
ncbi:MAG TPA: SDR family NAD(P)-dependent oxidoreductase [Sneathiellales bacterium]|jgi:NAD(P)-dependent dehydrogenase (short-subunit alcohol dehydrogenase family)|nr:SDR family NAD(P)-dependent oxidoreductase [Sneathiellales bacterium]